ncbi:MAG TPA: hypothetical protein VK457_25430 [Chloroflexota bacterium]|nr:hypothetical protein [Chloroflexota bacterium]
MSIGGRIALLDWAAIDRSLDEHGYATAAPLLNAIVLLTLASFTAQSRYAG